MLNNIGYSDDEFEVIFENRTDTFEEVLGADGSGDGQFVSKYGDFISLEVGTMYKVVWDGKTRMCRCYDHTEGAGLVIAFPMLGNSDIVFEGGYGNGEEFFLMDIPSGGVSNTNIYTRETDATHTVSLYKLVEEKKLPEVSKADEGKILKVVDGEWQAAVGGADGKDGKDGISSTHSWNGTVLTITSASGTSSADLKGSKGDKGDDGKDYVLTEADKQEIAGMVEVTDGGDGAAEKDVVPQTTLPASEVNGLFGGYATQTDSFEMNVGETYNVNWDGEEFTCVAQDASSIGGQGSALIGNGTLFGLSGNGEPFSIAIVGALGCALFIGDDTAPTVHTVRVYQKSAFVPNASAADNGKFLRVVDGVPAWVALTDVSQEGA